MLCVRVALLRSKDASTIRVMSKTVFVVRIVKIFVLLFKILFSLTAAKAKKLPLLCLYPL